MKGDKIQTERQTSGNEGLMGIGQKDRDINRQKVTCTRKANEKMRQ